MARSWAKYGLFVLGAFLVFLVFMSPFTVSAASSPPAVNSSSPQVFSSTTDTVGQSSIPSLIASFMNDGLSIFSLGNYSILVSIDTSGGSWAAPTNNGTTWIQSYSKGAALSYNLIWKPIQDQSGAVTSYKLTIQGSTNANGQRIEVRIGLQSGRFIQAGQTRFYAGNNSTGRIVGVGFDWADALNVADPSDLSQAVVGKLGIVRFRLAQGQFIIDPSTVGTSTSSGALPLPSEQRYVLYANTRRWVFWCDGTNIVWSSSTNGTSWATKTTVRACTYDFSVATDGDSNGHHVYYLATIAGGAAHSYLMYRRGTLNSDGTITWTAVEQTILTYSGTTCDPTVINGQIYYITRANIFTTSNGTVWVSFSVEHYSQNKGTSCSNGADTSPTGVYAWQNKKYDGTWSSAVTNTLTTTFTFSTGCGGSGVNAVFQWGTSTQIAAYNNHVTTYQWYTKTGGTAYVAGQAVSMTCVGENGWLVYETSGDNIVSNEYLESSNTLAGETTIQSSVTSTSYPSLSLDSGTNNLYAFWMGTTANHIYYSEYTSSWSSSTDWITDATLTANKDISSFVSSYGASMIGVIWLQNTGSPFNVRYAEIQFTVIQPITLTVISGGTVGTFTLSGCSPSPATVVGDGSAHNIVADPSCTMTITVPSDQTNSRQRLSGGTTSTTVTTCGSGTCTGFSANYYTQFTLTVTSSGIGSDTGGTVITINSVGYAQSVLPYVSGWLNASTTITYAYTSPVSSSSSGKRYLWLSTSGFSQSAQSGSFSLTSVDTLTGTYVAQYDLDVKAVDKYSRSTLATSMASMTVGATTLTADSNGYMDFGFYNSGSSMNIVAKYHGTVVNSTWQTSPYLINSLSVYQWSFEYAANLTTLAVVPAGQSTDGTNWNFTAYYVTGNSSAKASSGIVYVYYQQKTNLACSKNITAAFTICTATKSLAGPMNPGTANIYLNVTDGFIWVRSPTAVSYGINDVGLTNDASGSWANNIQQVIGWSYENTAKAGSTYLVVSNSFIQVSLRNATATLYNMSTAYFNAAANGYSTGTINFVVPPNFQGLFVLRFMLMQHLTNGTNIVVDSIDKSVVVSIGAAQNVGGNQVVSVPNDVAFYVDQGSDSEVPKVTQDQNLDWVANVQIQGLVRNVVIGSVTINAPWITLNDSLPIVLGGSITGFPLHLHLAPRGIAAQGYSFQIVVQGTIDNGQLWQPIKMVAYVYPSQQPQPTPIPTNFSTVVEIGLGGFSVVLTVWGAVRQLRKVLKE